VHDIAALFPFLRPEDDVVLAFADRAADDLGERDHIPPAIVEEAAALVPADERARLVNAFAHRYVRRWASVVDAVGDSAAAERALVLSAVRAAIGERRLPPRGVLQEVERNRAMLDTPPKVLLFVIQHGSVWSRDDAHAAVAAVAKAPRAEVRRAVDTVAATRLDRSHPRRVRTLAGHLARRLPVARFPRTSSLLEQACADVAEDDALADELARESLSVYVFRLTIERGLRAAAFN
jgi:hypothetical protein